MTNQGINGEIENENGRKAKKNVPIATQKFVFVF